MQEIKIESEKKVLRIIGIITTTTTTTTTVIVFDDNNYNDSV